MKKFCVAFILCFFAHQISFAANGEEKNLKGRTGLGFTNQIATTSLGTISALSAKHYLSRAFAFSLGTGFDTQSAHPTMALGAKIYRNVFYESNFIFYMGAGIAYVNQHGSKAQGSAFIGSEFFLPQIPSLGLSFEAGIRGDSTTGSFAIRTIGDSFLTAGMHFYL